MEKITVRFSNGIAAADQIAALRRELERAERAVGLAGVVLNWSCLGSNFAGALRRSKSTLQDLESRMTQMSEALREVMELYRTGEQRVVGQANGEVSEYAVDSVLFDDEGSYGGDQGSLEYLYALDPIRCWGILHMLREYYPNMSIFQAFTYFSKLNSSGCSYVALANTIFMEYEGRPEAFEARFGFPMYGSDGDLNYNRLILDVYATTDLTGYDGPGLPGGPNTATIQSLYRNYLDAKGLSSDMNMTGASSMSAEDFRQAVERGDKVILLVIEDNMYAENGSPHYIGGGHAVTVTGVTEDGRYVVSSWGEKYYVDPSEMDGDDHLLILNYNS